uniref:Uncharacterized protein n=1 Tax=Ananas comosus var. bracteatus TaxID=296719 RepID=A0A6V7QAT9_ANACO|nr:unnamed protein product [Ananas comosus var. bracteatus]
MEATPGRTRRWETRLGNRSKLSQLHRNPGRRGLRSLTRQHCRTTGRRGSSRNLLLGHPGTAPTGRIRAAAARSRRAPMGRRGDGPEDRKALAPRKAERRAPPVGRFRAAAERSRGAPTARRGTGLEAREARVSRKAERGSSPTICFRRVSGQKKLSIQALPVSSSDVVSNACQAGKTFRLGCSFNCEVVIPEELMTQSQPSLPPLCKGPRLLAGIFSTSPHQQLRWISWEGGFNGPIFFQPCSVASQLLLATGGGSDYLVACSGGKGHAPLADFAENQFFAPHSPDLVDFGDGGSVSRHFMVRDSGHDCPLLPLEPPLGCLAFCGGLASSGQQGPSGPFFWKPGSCPPLAGLGGYRRRRK